ncbi:hypothetical protein BGX24_012207 [Mortierella sp. AD032]|nr:hypothetical protein BGX24_012207 [Mortierella sp. AD032]
MIEGRLPILPPNVVKVDAVFWSSNGQYNREDKPGPVNQHMEDVTVKNVEHLGQLQQVFFQAPKLRRLIIRDLMLQDSLEVRAKDEHRLLAVLEAEQKKEEELDELAAVSSGVQVVKCENIRRRGKDSSFPLERLFRFTPKLVEFYNPYWTMEMASVFAEYCPLLEVVCIEERSSRQQANLARNAKQPFSDSISPLLTACSKLRVVDIRYDFVDAKNVAEKPWVCLGLEELRCQFVGVPYLTEKEHKTVDRILAREKKEKSSNKKSALDTDGTTTSRSESEEELCERTKRAQEIRCQVLTQLSKLSRLKHLTLSPDLKNTDFSNTDMYALIYRSKKDGLHYINYNDAQPDTLHLRLDCGLDQLATLTDLEYLAFESMDPMMRKEDIEWLSKHFPRLKEMRGLALDTHVGVEEDLEKSALRNLLQTLRPDILHTESL